MSLAAQKFRAETLESRAENNMDTVDLTDVNEQDAEISYDVDKSIPADSLCTEIQSEAKSETAVITESAEKTVDEDLVYLREKFSELHDIDSISSLPNPTRYAALRDLGLTPEEAYLATGQIRKENTKAHLSSSVPRAASAPLGAMSKQELSDARNIFCDMDDNEIQRLYKRVTN